MVISNLLRSIVLTTSVSLSMASAVFAAEPPAPAAPVNPPAAAAPEAAASPTPATSPTPAASPTPAPAAQLTPEAKAEADAASHLEKKFQEAARSYRMVQKNGENMYCKKEKPIGSTIPRMQCITEAQLRLQVEQMDQLRDKLRNSGRCTAGTGCLSGS
jgi:hypothetical protein